MRTRAVTVWSSLCVGAIVGCSSPGASLPATSGAAALRVASTLALGGASARSVDVRDSVAAVGCGSDGLFLVDVSRPDAPVVLSHLRDIDASAVAFGTDGLVVASAAPAFGGSTSLRVVDVLDPREPVVGAPFSVTFDEGADLSTEGGSVAAPRRRNGPLVTDEHRLELAQSRAVVGDGIDDAVLLRRGLLFVHATTSRWNGADGHHVVIAPADRGEARDTIPLVASPPSVGALALLGDDLLCASADRVEVVTSVTTPARRLVASLPIEDVRRMAVDGTSALLLAAGGRHVVLVEPQAGGDPAPVAALELDAVGRDVAVRGADGFLAAGDAGLIVVRIERESSP